MKRVKGTAGVSLFECINADLNKWNVRWDVQENPETDEGQTNGINYMEETFLFKPDLSDVQQIISFGVEVRRQPQSLFWMAKQ